MALKEAFYRQSAPWRQEDIEASTMPAMQLPPT